MHVVLLKLSRPKNVIGLFISLNFVFVFCFVCLLRGNLIPFLKILLVTVTSAYIWAEKSCAYISVEVQHMALLQS